MGSEMCIRDSPFTVQNENESEGDTDVKTTNIKIVNEEIKHLDTVNTFFFNPANQDVSYHDLLITMVFSLCILLIYLFHV